MGLPPASPPRIASSAALGGVPLPPPPPTYQGEFVRLESVPNLTPASKQKQLWEYSSSVVQFLNEIILPRFFARTQAYTDSDVNALSKAETALHFHTTMTLPQGEYDPSRNYAAPNVRAFDYVRTGRADAFLDRVIALFQDDPIPMPNPRAAAEEFEDWILLHGGRRRRTGRKTRRGKRTYRHSVRKRQG